ncbi:uncharacterized protein [Oryza sativa Japonica Group]|uniref:Os07g0102200 protein n=2 Tax=Oryza sativa subsp. japonica TaxID=39947 RepID=Q0D978_ORYSJ|nr:uncharacterized protein LOC4342174 isoform X1 [Oryza sativa Japonica Group]KAF2921061.1 hypothetical protein DAI22_07g001600 [Oryza sativa Japonica Group]BAF20595.1 Os07g0102200 [Oryza sativa Japonica Group]BAS99687.1 Os07g0102200 [Oryza sativa Japonica Group]|eukprot:NP_001058681.1 Os07g0102200 [Oryza sativa Japonica Group]
MIPSAPRRTACPCRSRRRNVAAGKAPPLVASSVTARALAAGLWRLRQAERSAAAAARRQDNQPRPSLLGVGGRKGKAPSEIHFGIGRKQQCCRSHGNGNGILDKIEAACSSSYSYCGSMEKATKWDNGKKQSLVKKEIGSSSSRRMRSLENALEKARAEIVEMEEEKRLMSRKLRKVAEEKAAAREELKLERHHRRELEGANGKLVKEVARARQRVETERKARELMEEACEELSKEVEEDQAEVEALRRECVSMREEMEEERRMLQMAEVWREERVQMKLSDAKAVLEHKYAHLNTLQSEMESFLLRHGHRTHNHAQHRRTVDMLAASVRGANADDGLFPPANTYKSPHAPDDVDKVFDHFRRNNTDTSSSVASPATDLFLEKLEDDDDGGWPWERETPRPPPHHTSNAACSNSNDHGGRSGVTEEEGGSGRSRRSGNFNTALIRRLWQSAISESRRKTAASASGRNRVLHNGFSPSRSSTVVDQAGSAAMEKENEINSKNKKKKKKSLMEKLMEARMDDHHTADKPCQPQIINYAS